VQSDARPSNTGRTLIDAHTAETWRKLMHRTVRGLGANDLGYTDPACRGAAPPPCLQRWP
jgi:hypothetical protein